MGLCHFQRQAFPTASTRWQHRPERGRLPGPTVSTRPDRLYAIQSASVAGGPRRERDDGRGTGAGRERDRSGTGAAKRRSEGVRQPFPPDASRSLSLTSRCPPETSRPPLQRDGDSRRHPAGGTALPDRGGGGAAGPRSRGRRCRHGRTPPAAVQRQPSLASSPALWPRPKPRSRPPEGRLLRQQPAR